MMVMAEIWRVNVLDVNARKEISHKWFQLRRQKPECLSGRPLGPEEDSRLVWMSLTGYKHKHKKKRRDASG